MIVGDRVKIERDEQLYPSKGSWPQFRGRTGTVVEINHDRKRPHLTEYGLAIGKSLPASGKRGGSMTGNAVTWFKSHEIRVLASQAATSATSPLPRMDHTQEIAA